MDWLKRLKFLEKEIENLSAEDCWGYLKWEWLRRNPFYCGVSKKYYSYEGIFPMATRQLHELKQSKKTPKQKSRLKKLILAEFQASCGLKLPVDPIKGTWKDCQWGAPYLSHAFADIDRYSGFEIAQREKEKQRVLTEVLDLGNKIPQFLRLIDLEYQKHKRLTKDTDGTEVSSSLFNHGYTRFKPPRIRAAQFAEALVIWDIRKAVKKCSNADVAEMLGRPIKKQKYQSGTANPEANRIMKQFLIASRHIRESVNFEFKSHWK